MRKRERFGSFALLEQIETSGLGTEFRAAKLGPSGLEKIVSLLRLSQKLSSCADVAKALMEQTKIAAALHHPNILKTYGVGKVDGAYYVSCEFIEGKSLKAILKRCRQERFPFSTDHALLIASKVCDALEFAHEFRTRAAGRHFHGLLNSGAVMVSYEGAVGTRGFGYWPAHIREAGGVAAEDLLYLAPEQVAGGAGEPRSDIFAVGALLYEALTGQALFQNGRDTDIGAAVAQARLQGSSGDDDALPRSLSEILLRALAHDPGARYAEVQELRKAIDTLLFSGNYTPTTSNLAFFMHSLFREDIERESKQLKEEREASYLEYLTEEAGAPGVGEPPAGTALRDGQARACVADTQPTATHAAPRPQPHAVFISYRREDTEDLAGRIYDKLASAFPRASIFRDHDSIPLGVDFESYVGDVLRSCRVLLVVIGRKWLETRDGAGRRRLDDPRDLVRMELRTALELGRRVIPVLVHGAKLPASVELPHDICDVVKRQGTEVRADPHFHTDMERLLATLQSILET